MSPENFTYWLNGFLELSGATTLNEQQVQVIKEHLALVLTKITPSTVQPYVPVPIYPSNPMPSDKGWEITCTTTDKLYPIGPKCGGCNKVCSDEGGTCKKCQTITTTSHAFPPDTKISVSDDMKQDLKAFMGIDLQENTNTSQLPIVDVPTCLTC